MKRKYLGFAALLLVFLCGCSDFPTVYERVDAGKVRLLDIIYEPAEAAPGDTVLCTAVFAGNDIAAESITWSISHNLIINMYGFVNARDTVPLDPVFIDSTFSDSTSCVSFRFVIPPDIMLTSPLIPADWMSLIPPQYHALIPDEIKSMSKPQLIGFVDTLSQSAAGGSRDTALLTQELLAYIPAIAQLLTVQVRLYARPANGSMIESYYSVRFNRRFAALPECGVFVNTNPAIDSAGIYKVKKDGLRTYDPATDPYEAEFIRLYGFADTAFNDSIQTILIDANYSYFMAGFTSRLDSTLSIDAAMSGGGALKEKHLCQWYFQLCADEVKDVSAFDYMNIGSMGNAIEPLHPAIDRRVVSATIWLEAYDQLLNEIYRPQGSALKEVRVRFEYTDAYIASANDK